jgi:hypothetical protein
MRRILNLLTFIVLAQLAAMGAAPNPPLLECPSITVETPSDLICPASEVTFTASVLGGDPNIQQTYHWTVSAGRIVSGQGTPTITVATADASASLVGNGEGITATVALGGFTALTTSCPQTASRTVRMAGCCLPRKFDEYGDIQLNDEKARLGNFAIQLRNEPEALGYILIYAGKRAHVNEAERRLERAKNYVVIEHGINAQRIVTIDGGYREDLTVELWVLPENFPPLTPDKASTIDPSQVEIIPDPPQSTRTRKRNR